MTGTYQPGLVFLSVLVAIFVSHTALSLSARVARAPRRVKPLWLVGGSVAMGVGIWSMHFIGMLAFALPIALSYSIPTTLGSLVIAIASSSFALALASHPHVHTRRLAWGALIMGGGICAMHYSGMAAIQIVPMITYEPLLVVASVLIAVGASFAALWLFSHLGSGFSLRVQVLRISAAFAMGLAISGMHYTGMAASRFASGSYCLGGGIGWQGADSRWLALIIGVAVLALLAITTLLLLYHADLEAKNRQHNRSLAEANAQLQHVATHDALTGLPNRLLLRDRLEQAIAQSERDGQRCAVLVVDLDRFKAINDSLGHQAGDALLREVSARLGSQLRRTDTLARLGGDEFVLVLREIAGPQQAEAVAGKLLVEVSKPLQLAGLEVQISSSIGISICPDDAADSEQLLQHADAAMFHAKKSGRNMCQFFAPAMNAFSRERLEMENGLRRALEVGELELHYQPKVDISTGRVRSAEALLRWQHPTRGLILPAGFVPLAEETGLIIPIGEWVLNEACRQARAWQLAGVPFVRIAVNLSAQQFKQTNLVDAVRLALNASQLDAG